MKINLLRCINNYDNKNKEENENNFIKFNIKNFKLPIKINKELASELLKDYYQKKEKIPVSYTMMYS